MKQPISNKVIINPGNPAHHHVEEVTIKDGKTIGHCKCGYEVDYTQAHRSLPEMRDGYTQRSFNLNQLVKKTRGRQTVRQAEI